MKVAALFSGGKDSTFAIYWAVSQGWDVSCLVTLKSANQHSYMFHTPNLDMVPVQAKAMCIPLILEQTSGEKETELADLERALTKARDTYGVTGVLVGAIASDYQQERVNRICAHLGLKTFAPLWHKDQAQILLDLIQNGFVFSMISIAADGLDQSYLGKPFDTAMVEKLCLLSQKMGLNPAGEGGEFETFVQDGPIFKQSIAIDSSEKVMDGICTGYLQINSYHLTQKTCL